MESLGHPRAWLGMGERGGKNPWRFLLQPKSRLSDPTTVWRAIVGSTHVPQEQFGRGSAPQNVEISAP